MQENLDVERLILSKLSDTDLIKACHLNSRNLNKVCNDQFFFRILMERYPDTVDLEYGTKNWREKYLTVVKWIAKLREDYDYVYTGEDPKLQYDILEPATKRRIKTITSKLHDAARTGQLSLVKYLLAEKVDLVMKPHVAQITLVPAAQYGHFKILDYLISQGADVSYNDDILLALTAKNGNLDVVKFLVEQGAQNLTRALQQAALAGKLEVAKYLVSQGAQIDATVLYNATLYQNMALKITGEHNGILDYLKSQ